MRVADRDWWWRWYQQTLNKENSIGRPMFGPKSSARHFRLPHSTLDVRCSTLDVRSPIRRWTSDVRCSMFGPKSSARHFLHSRLPHSTFDIRCSTLTFARLFDVGRPMSDVQCSVTNHPLATSSPPASRLPPPQRTKPPPDKGGGFAKRSSVDVAHTSYLFSVFVASAASASVGRTTVTARFT